MSSVSDDRATHVQLPDTDWAFWRPVALRAPGFPADAGLLASPGLVAEADAVESGDKQSLKAFRAAFDADGDRIAARLVALIDDPRFRRALAWQNHRIFETALEPMRRNLTADPVRRHSKQRQREDLIASYWHRYCLKNDTIGFFGPVGWGAFDGDAAETRLRPGRDLTSSSDVFFEAWAIDLLTEKIGATPGMASWVAPRKVPFVRLDGTQVVGPSRRPMTLTEVEAEVLRSSTGLEPARAIAARLAGQYPETETADDVYRVIERLAKKRLLVWKLQVPLSPYPEKDLRAFLEGIGDPEVAADGLERLSLLESARDRAWAAADGDLADFVSALRHLDEVFVKVTGGLPSRNSGQAYGGRTLVYHDARRDTEFVFGADLLSALAPLGPVLDSGRWLVHHFGARLEREFGEIVARLAADGGRVDLASFWFECLPVLHRKSPAMIGELQAELQRLWAEVLEVPEGESRVRLDGEQVRERARAAFGAAGSDWSVARYCSPDLMISAVDVEAIHRGEFEVVLGEAHLGFASYRHYLFVTQHPTPGDLFDCLDADWPAPRLLPVQPRESAGRLTIRTQPALNRDEDYQVALFEQTTEPGRPRVLHAADLVVELDDGRPTVTLPDGRTYPVLDLFAETVLNTVVDAITFLPPADHQPRITIDRLVLSRETWRLPAVELDFAQFTDPATRFVETRRWWRGTSLPQQVFVKVPGEVKPIFVDFENVFTINALAKFVRKLQATDPQAKVAISEMLPSLDRLWLADRDGNRYTSELRLVAVDRTTVRKG
ncbi:lantibiotic dehydratase [Amycolatopsis sp. NPDC005003]